MFLVEQFTITAKETRCLAFARQAHAHNHERAALWRLLEDNVAVTGPGGGQIVGAFLAEKLFEYRLSLDKVEFRFLFTDESGTFVMLAVYKEKRNDVPQGAIDSAEQRIALWRKRK